METETLCLKTIFLHFQIWNVQEVDSHNEGVIQKTPFWQPWQKDQMAKRQTTLNVTGSIVVSLNEGDLEKGNGRWGRDIKGLKPTKVRNLQKLCHIFEQGFLVSDVALNKNK